MRTLNYNGFLVIAFAVLGTLAASAGTEIRDSLQPRNIEAVRINLAPGGAGLGFEAGFAGDDTRLERLIALIRRAEPGRGHKCPSAGAIRFMMRDGSIVGVGLLPSHTAGEYSLRLYDGDLLVGVYHVDRAELLDALEDLGVPRDDPAFRE